MKLSLTVATIATLALGAGTAHAGTLVVDQAAGPYTTIGAAMDDAGNGDTIDVHAGTYHEQVVVTHSDLTIHGAPETTIAATTQYAVVVEMGGGTIDGVTVSGTQGGVQVANSTTIANSTITAADHALTIDGQWRTLVHHTLIRALDPAGTAVLSRNDQPVAGSGGDALQVAQFATDVVLGGTSGTAFDVRSGRAGETGSARGGIDLGISSTTVVGAPTAFSSGVDGLGGPVRVGALRSIVHGAAPGLLTYATETTAPDAADFVNPDALDFHLRADAPAAMFATPGPVDPSSWSLFPDGGLDTDFDGTPRNTAGIMPSAGAYAFVDHAPTATYTISPNPETGKPTTLDATSSVDPDAAIGGRIVKYIWQLQDQDVTTDQPVLQHTWRSYSNMGWGVILTTVDNNGRSTSSPHQNVFVPDHTPPVVTFSRPADQVRLHRYTTTVKNHKKRKTINVVRVSGKADGLDGIASVFVTIRGATKRGAPCRYVSVSGRLVTRACSKAAPVFKLMTKGAGLWGWASPQHKPFPAGHWTATVTAADVSGNVGASVLHFTVT